MYQLHTKSEITNTFLFLRYTLFMTLGATILYHHKLGEYEGERVVIFHKITIHVCVGEKVSPVAHADPRYPEVPYLWNSSFNHLFPYVKDKE